MLKKTNERKIRQKVEFFPKAVYDDLSAKLGGIDGSRFAPVVYEMPRMRVRTVLLGDGRNPLEGDGRPAKLHEMRRLRAKVLAPVLLPSGAAAGIDANTRLNLPQRRRKQMNYKAKLSYFVEEGGKEKYITLEIPAYAFEVDGGANRNILLDSTDDISITSELEQARTFKNLSVWVSRAEKKFNWKVFTELKEIADKDITLNLLFAIERYSEGKMLEGVALIDRGAGAYPPHVVEDLIELDFWIPSAKLYRGKVEGTTLKSPKEM